MVDNGAVSYFDALMLERMVGNNATPSAWVPGYSQLSRPGAGDMIGDQRNLLPTTFAGVRSVLSTSPISYSVISTTVSVTVSAVTFSGGDDVSASFGASSGSVTQSPGTTVTYWCYYRDATGAGGSKALNITTNVADLAAHNDIWLLGSFDATTLSSAASITNPIARFGYSPSNLAVSFSDFSVVHAPGSLTYLWEFGDNARSTSQNPSHTYSAAGTYRVTLTVRNSVGLTDTTTTLVTISGSSSTTPPRASFTYTNSGSSINFTNTSTAGTNAITHWTWDFGDGTGSSSQNPSHAYALGGGYQVRLTVSDSTGLSDSIIDTVSVLSGKGGGGGGMGGGGGKIP